MSESTQPPFPIRISKAREVALPLGLLVTGLVAVAVGYARWSATEEKVERHSVQIRSLEDDAKSTREILIRIEERGKAIDDKITDMRRNQRRESTP